MKLLLRFGVLLLMLIPISVGCGVDNSTTTPDAGPPPTEGPADDSPPPVTLEE